MFRAKKSYFQNNSWLRVGFPVRLDEINTTYKSTYLLQRTVLAFDHFKLKLFMWREIQRIRLAGLIRRIG